MEFNNTKVRVYNEELSREIQEKLFKMGYVWVDDSTFYSVSDDIYMIYINDHKKFFYREKDGTNKTGNYNATHKEIQPSDILDYEIIETKKHFDDLTLIDVPFGELDEDTKQRLKNINNGCNIENDYYTRFDIVNNPLWMENTIYRLKKDPVYLYEYAYRDINGIWSPCSRYMNLSYIGKYDNYILLRKFQEINNELVEVK